MKKTGFWGAVAAAMALSGTAGAQESENESVFLDEVIVTAQKREQNIQDVSISMTAFNNARLRALGVRQPRDIADFTPNLNIKNVSGAGNPTFNIRGVGVNVSVGSQNPAVGMYVDELYLPTNILMDFSLLDIERVEVLRGPQGTLFGRNTTGGAVTFTSARPSQESGGYVDVNLGNYQKAAIEAVFNGPLSDTVSARFAIRKDNQGEGYFFNETRQTDEGAVDTLLTRASLLWEPAEDWSILASLHYGWDRSDPYPFSSIQIYDDTSFLADARYEPVVDGQGNGYFGGAFRSTFCGSVAAGPNVTEVDPTCVDRSGNRETNGDAFTGNSSNTFRENDNEAWGGRLRDREGLRWGPAWFP